MGQPIDRPGTFRGNIIDFGLREEQSGAVAVTLKVALNQMWTGHEWVDWSQYDQEVEGFYYIIDRKGLNQNKVNALCRNAGWDGDLDSIIQQKWEPKPIGLTVEASEYKNQIQYRVGFINDYERTPGAASNLTPESAQALKAKYGAQLRALAGNISRGNGTPAGRPTPPPAPAPMAPAPPSEGDIPF